MIKPDVKGVPVTYAELLKRAPDLRLLEIAGRAIRALGWVMVGTTAALVVVWLGVAAFHLLTGEASRIEDFPVVAALYGAACAVALLTLGSLVLVARLACRDLHVMARASVEVDGGYVLP